MSGCVSRRTAILAPRGDETIPLWLCFRGRHFLAASRYTHPYTKKSGHRRHAAKRAKSPHSRHAPIPVGVIERNPPSAPWAYVGAPRRPPRGCVFHVFGTGGTPAAKASTNAGVRARFCLHPPNHVAHEALERTHTCDHEARSVVPRPLPSRVLGIVPVGGQTPSARLSQIESHTTDTSAPQDGSRTNKAFRPTAKSAMR